MPDRQASGRVQAVQVQEDVQESVEGKAQETSAAKKGRQLPVLLGPIIVVIILAIFWLPQLLSDAAATVDGESISKSELDRRVAFERLWNQWAGNAIPANGPVYDQFRVTVLDSMVENRLVLQQTKKSGATVTSEAVAARIQEIKTNFKLSDAQISDDLAKAGLTMQTLEGVMREDITVQNFVSTVVLKGVSIPDRDTTVRNWYNNALAKANIEKRIQGGGAKVGQPAPDFTLNGLDGKPVRLSDFKGKPVLINFFATWCQPCRAEMPDLEALWKAKKDDLVVLAVNLTNQDTISDVNNYMKELGLTFPVALDEKGNVSTLYRVGPIPTSYFVNRQGNLAAVQVGTMSPQVMNQRISKLQ